MELFKAKAKNYRQMSAMIRDAVAQFDDIGTVKRIESLNNLADLITNFNHEISKQGGNLNQITKRANELIYQSERNILQRGFSPSNFTPAKNDEGDQEATS